MIEHFKKWDLASVREGDKSLLPLSFSHLNEFAFNRERWALRRIFGYQFPSSASAERGKAVESGLNMWLNGMDKQDAIDKMVDEFQANCKLFDDPKKEEEEYSLIPLFNEGINAFNEFGFKWNLLGYQKKVELDIHGVPLIGYTDFHFEDKQTKEDFYIDLKTTKRKPSGLSMSHAMQQAIYQRGTNANQKLWYLIAKKSSTEFESMSLTDYDKPFRICEHIVFVMANYLKQVNSLDDVRDTLIPNPDDWIWRDNAVLEARKEVWGY